MGNITHHEVFTQSFVVLIDIWPNLIQMALIYRVYKKKVDNFEMSRKV